MATNHIKLTMDTCYDLPNPGLRAYFEHVEKGNSDEYRTTFYKGKKLEDILSKWNRTLVGIRDAWPTLYEFEVDLGSKVGPMSIMKPLSERMGDIEHYYEDIHLSSKPISGEAVKATVDWFSKLRGLRVRSTASTVEAMKKSTNSGAPYFTKRRSVVDKTVPFVLENGMQKLPKGDYPYTAILGWRGQEGGPEVDDVKQRVVWMFPFAVNIDELRVYQPLIQGCQKAGLVPAWNSMDMVDLTITKMFDTKHPDDLIVCTDFSKFDQHFNSDMQECAKAIISSLMDHGFEEQRWLHEVFPIKYNIPLNYAWNQFKTGPHGMGSGSGGTNADETLAHRALQYEAALNKGQTLNPYSQCLGDDGILTYPGITVDDVVHSYTAHGQEMNVSKQYASKQDCVYLRRWHHTDYRMDDVCVGVYSTNRALGRLAEQERFYSENWSPYMVALRQLAIIENVKYHPLREQFADYCMKGDKYRLGLDLPGFFERLDSIAKEATDLMPDFLGYTKSLAYENDRGHRTSLSSWWIVQYLLSRK